LSYTTFEYSDIQLSQTTMDEYGSIKASVTVTNTGDVAAKDSVLLFLFDSYRRVTPEYKLLKK
jgi:beta-glucosidase